MIVGTIVCAIDASDAAGARLVVVHALADVSAVVSYPGGSASAPPLSAQPDARQRLAE